MIPRSRIWSRSSQRGARRSTSREKAIAAFITGPSAEKQDKAKKLFAGLFDTLDQERSEVMSGLERVARKRRSWPTASESDVGTLHQLEDRPGEDPSKITALASQVEWSTRIFEDRRKTIRYAARCRPRSNSAHSRWRARSGKRWIEATLCAALGVGRAGLTS